MVLRKFGIGGLLAACVWGVTTGALAAEPPSAPAPASAQPSEASLALARRYIELSHLQETFAAMLKSMLPVMLDQLSKADPQAPPELRSAVSEAMQEAAPAMMQKLIDRAVPIYAEVYTEQELRAIVAFAGSPEGQAMISKAPIVLARLAPAMRDIMPEFQAELLARVCGKIDCTGARRTLKPSAT